MTKCTNNDVIDQKLKNISSNLFFKKKETTYSVSNNFNELRSGIFPTKLLFPSQLQEGNNLPISTIEKPIS